MDLMKLKLFITIIFPPGIRLSCIPASAAKPEGCSGPTTILCSEIAGFLSGTGSRGTPVGASCSTWRSQQEIKINWILSGSTGLCQRNEECAPGNWELFSCGPLWIGMTSNSAYFFGADADSPVRDQRGRSPWGVFFDLQLLGSSSWFQCQLWSDACLGTKR